MGSGGGGLSTQLRAGISGSGAGTGSGAGSAGAGRAGEEVPQALMYSDRIAAAVEQVLQFIDDLPAPRRERPRVGDDLGGLLDRLLVRRAPADLDGQLALEPAGGSGAG